MPQVSKSQIQRETDIALHQHNYLKKAYEKEMEKRSPALKEIYQAAFENQDAQPEVLEKNYTGETSEEAKNVKDEFIEIWFRPLSDGKMLKDKYLEIPEVRRYLSKEFQEKDTLRLLQHYIFLCLAIKKPLEKTEQAMKHLRTVKNELEKENPNIKTIDNELSEFAYYRIEDYYNVIDQKLAEAAEMLNQYFRANPDEDNPYLSSNLSVDEWFPAKELKKHELEMIKEEAYKDWKSAELTSEMIQEKVFRATDVFKLDGEFELFIP